jgi:hypothetical protein
MMLYTTELKLNTTGKDCDRWLRQMIFHIKRLNKISLRVKYQTYNLVNSFSALDVCCQCTKACGQGRGKQAYPHFITCFFGSENRLLFKFLDSS